MFYKICFVSSVFFPVALHAQNSANSYAQKWSGNTSAYFYFIPQKKAAPTISGYADNDSSNLHLEGRFDYEDLNTVSAFAGYEWKNNASGKFQLTVIPMAGAAVGRTNGLLPGLEFNFVYKSFTVYSENEYMLNFKAHQSDFFYSWTQFNKDVFKNIKAGVLAQSLRLYETKFALQRGIFAEYNKGIFTFDVYYFNLFTTSHFMMASGSINF